LSEIIKIIPGSPRTEKPTTEFPKPESSSRIAPPNLRLRRPWSKPSRLFFLRLYA